MSANLVIGIRDSGVGGLTVARRILQRLPNAQLLYFADTAHVPYGDKTPEQVRHYALSISQFLIERGAGAIVFACNTTSALALESARERFDVPIFGVIRPGARVAARQTKGKIGVLATAATVESRVYTKVLRELNSDLETLEIGCPAFVPLVENRQTNSLEAAEACKHYLAPLLRFGADTIILGCTHYPLLLPLFQQAAPQICFIDPALAVAEEVFGCLGVSVLETNSSTPSAETPEPRHTFYVSGPQTGVGEWIADLLNNENPILKTAPVFDLEPELELFYAASR